MKLIFSSVLIFCLPVFSNADNGEASAFFQKSDIFLKKYTMKGLVSYTKIKQNLSEIEELYKMVGNMKIDQLSASEQKAFYINAYNIIVIYQVSKYYPLKSAMDQSGFFDKVKHDVGGKPMSLNALEILHLLKTFPDARIHFALACAAKSCPPLASFAFLPGQLDQQLENRSRLAINDPKFIKVDAENKKVGISMMFKWYARDFNKDGQNVRSFIETYRNQKIPTDYSFEFYEYDWALNDM